MIDLTALRVSPEVLLEQLEWALVNADAHKLPEVERKRIERMIIAVVEACLAVNWPLSCDNRAV